MAESNKAGGVVLGAGAALLAALLAGKKLQAAEGVTPDEILDAAAQADSKSLGNALNNLAQQVSALNYNLSGTGVGGANPESFTAFRALCAAANTPYRLPDRSIPYKMTLVVKALPTNGGVIYVAPSAADSVNVNSAYTLIANEAVELEIINANKVYIAATAAGEGVTCIVEQRGV